MRTDGAASRLRLERLDLRSGARTPFREIGPRDPVGVGGIGKVVVSRDGGSIAFNYARRLSELYRLPRLER